MSDRARLSRLTLRNLLSFGPEGVDVELRALNVLIGPNASGKSNFIDAISLLGAMPTDLSVPIREGGGIAEWLWRGDRGRSKAAGPASIEARFVGAEVEDLRHKVQIGAEGTRAVVLDERIDRSGMLDPDEPESHFHYAGDQALIYNFSLKRHLGTRPLDKRESVLAPRRDGNQFPTLAAIRTLYDDIRVYRDWDTRRGGVMRSAQPADLPEDFLMPDAQNLGVVLNNLQRHTEAWEALNASLARLHPNLAEVRTLVQSNTVQIMLRERDLKTLTPAARMSDGTLRWLALLAVLVHPEPPSLVAIEEPELGLHPDLIDDLAKLLVDASTRTQLVVSTHSDHLIDALSSDPGSVIVAEREPGGTALRRLDAERLSAWLDKYRLGELWMKGEIGGTRW